MVGKSFFEVVRRAPLSAQCGLVVIALYCIVAVLAPLVARYPEAAIVAQPYEPWGAAYWLGTDNLGRDLYSRLIYATRNTLSVAIVITILAFALGASAGLVAATRGGLVDQLLSRLVDAFMCIPMLIFTLLLSTIFGTSLLSLVLIVSFLESLRVFRVARAAAVGVASSDFVEAARLRGERHAWVMFHEILPNIRFALLAELGLRFCFIFLLISGLAFLGLGIQPPTADWGSMVRENATLIAYGDVTPLLPALAIALLAVSINLVMDWILRPGRTG